MKLQPHQIRKFLRPYRKLILTIAFVFLLTFALLNLIPVNHKVDSLSNNSYSTPITTVVAISYNDKSQISSIASDSDVSAIDSLESTIETSNIETESSAITETASKSNQENFSVDDFSSIPTYAKNIMCELGIDSFQMLDYYNRIRDISARIAYVESNGEPYEGQVAVIATFLNRLKDSKFPNTPETVAKAYASYNRVSTLTVKQHPTIEKALDAALSGEDPTKDYLNGLGALYFYNPDLCGPIENARRANISVTHRIGHHIFYAVWDGI